MTKNAKELKDMIKRLERYLRYNKLILSTEKSKVLQFRKGGGRERNENWAWEDVKIEQVKEHKYLGYYFQQNNGDSKHIKEREKRTRVAIN